MLSEKNLSEVTGLVRKGERQNSNTKVDVTLKPDEQPVKNLQEIGKQFKILNLIAASAAYVQMFEPENTPISDNLYPVPARKHTFTRPYLTPDTHFNYAVFWGSAATVGFVSIFIILRKW
jgi:cytochrome oxidase assembly protein ShyY1